MANAPTFDPNNRRHAQPWIFRNGAVANVYEPGSTLKVVTVAAAIEEGIVEPSTVFEVPPEYVIPLEPEPKVYQDVGHEDTLAMSVGEIVARSSNVGTLIALLNRYSAVIIPPARCRVDVFQTFSRGFVI